jgi:hypothetical protein
MLMPRSVEEIIAHADEYAACFENYEPRVEDELPCGALHLLRQAVRSRSDAEREMLEAVIAARQLGTPWSLIGSVIGTSGEAARQRYGSKVVS